MLVRLAAEPVVRLRVLAYGEELGILEQVDDAFKTSTARAEAELALWLSQPAHIGLPPTRCELVDSRMLYWPGYEEPLECFLFHFIYDFGDKQFSNIGLTRPADAFVHRRSGQPVARRHLCRVRRMARRA